MEEKEEREERIIKGISIGIQVAIFLVGLGVITFLLLAVVPTFVQMIIEVGMPLPLPTRITMGMSNSLRQYWFFILPFVVLILILAIWGTKRIFKRLPIWLPILLIPISIILMGLLAGLIVVSMYLPIFQMSQMIK